MCRLLCQCQNSKWSLLEGYGFYIPDSKGTLGTELFSNETSSFWNNIQFQLYGPLQYLSNCKIYYDDGNDFDYIGLNFYVNIVEENDIPSTMCYIPSPFEPKKKSFNFVPLVIGGNYIVSEYFSVILKRSGSIGIVVIGAIVYYIYTRKRSNRIRSKF
jgi:hypothetical protein